VANRALLVEPSSTEGRAVSLPGGRRVGQTIVTQTAGTRANAAKPGPETGPRYGMVLRGVSLPGTPSLRSGVA